LTEDDLDDFDHRDALCIASQRADAFGGRANCWPGNSSAIMNECEVQPEDPVVGSD